jgi:hypothetical protein
MYRHRREQSGTNRSRLRLLRKLKRPRRNAGASFIGLGAPPQLSFGIPRQFKQWWGAARHPPCSQNRGREEPDDLLCSRNTRPQKALVGRAHDGNLPGRPSNYGAKDGNSVRQTTPHGHRPAAEETVECPSFFVQNVAHAKAFKILLKTSGVSTYGHQQPINWRLLTYQVDLMNNCDYAAPIFIAPENCELAWGNLCNKI